MGLYENEPMEPAYYQGPVRNESAELRVIALIIACTAVIFYIDIITPLGFSIWILYLVPLLLTLYVQWKYAPFAASAVFTGLIIASFFLSPQDMPAAFAVANRVFFAIILLVTSVFIWNYNGVIEHLRRDEKRYRYLAESMPDTLLVHRDGTIVYINPAGLRMFGADRCHDMLHRDLNDFVLPPARENFQEISHKVMDGALIPVHEVFMTRLDGTGLRVDALDEKVLWDGIPAIQVILREVSAR